VLAASEPNGAIGSAEELDVEDDEDETDTEESVEDKPAGESRDICRRGG
jgi:hypothetical protein